MNLLIIGAGGHGKVVKEVAESLNIYDKIEFVDDNSADAVGKISDLAKLKNEYEVAFVGIGNNKLRMELLKQVKECGYHIPVLIHPTAYVSKSAIVREGSIVEPKAIVNAYSNVGVGCIVSAGSIVDHDVILEDGVHVCVGAICKAGSVIAVETRVESGQVIKGY